MRADFFKIDEINISGNVSINTEEINTSIKNILAGNYFYVLPKDNILIYPKKEIVSMLRDNYARLDTINVSTDRSSLRIDLTERKPEALWCGQSFSETIDPCLFIDSTGYIFAPAPQFDGSSYVKLYGAMFEGKQPGINGTSTSLAIEVNSSTVGWQFISPAEYKSIIDFIKNSGNLGVEMYAVEISDTDNYKFEIKNNGLLLADRNTDLADTFENLKAGLSNQLLWTKATNKKPKTLAQFKYLDLRYDNKIFYKYSGK